MSATLTPAPEASRSERLAAGRARGRWQLVVLWLAVIIAALATTSYWTGLLQLTSSGTVSSALRLSLPILLAALGGLWAERAGVINIGLEGMMILGTWGAAWAGYQWGPWAALGAAAVFGAMGGLLHALATVTFGVNQIVSGVAINLLGAGVTRFLSELIFQPVSQNPRESPAVPKFGEFAIQPIAEWLRSLESMQRVGISDVAGILLGLTSGLTPLVVVSVALVPISYLVLWRTRWGLRVRSVGENPQASESLGINVYLYKYLAVTASGALAGLGGAALVLNPGQPGYLEGQTGGRGYIALAAMIFGNWRPGGLLGGSALFGYADALQLRNGPTTVHSLLYAASLVLALLAAYYLFRRRVRATLWAGFAGIGVYCLYWFTDQLPSELTSYAPQLITLVVLAVSAQRLRPPASIGRSYQRGGS